MNEEKESIGTWLCMSIELIPPFITSRAQRLPIWEKQQFPMIWKDYILRKKCYYNQTKRGDSTK